LPQFQQFVSILFGDLQKAWSLFGEELDVVMDELNEGLVA
jgi:hypothetical protein